MNRYEELKIEIEETLTQIEEAEQEILVSKELIAQIRSDLDTANGPGLGAYRQSLIDDIRNLKDDLEWWYDEKDMLYSRLEDLKNEKARL